jgi:hypothetical protein
MNFREQQLRERDVRRDAPALDPGAFLRMYMASTFPQTAALPSPEQKQNLVATNNPEDQVKSNKKMALSGTQYDNPGGQ